MGGSTKRPSAESSLRFPPVVFVGAEKGWWWSAGRLSAPAAWSSMGLSESGPREASSSLAEPLLKVVASEFGPPVQLPAEFR